MISFIGHLYNQKLKITVNIFLWHTKTINGLKGALYQSVVLMKEYKMFPLFQANFLLPQLRVNSNNCC